LLIFRSTFPANVGGQSGADANRLQARRRSERCERGGEPMAIIDFAHDLVPHDCATVPVMAPASTTHYEWFSLLIGIVPRDVEIREAVIAG
jgi:hypothetical protein